MTRIIPLFRQNDILKKLKHLRTEKIFLNWTSENILGWETTNSWGSPIENIPGGGTTQLLRQIFLNLSKPTFEF